jgi:hypothetical protein
MLYSLAGDAASIHRFGFRAADGTLNWLSDPTGDQSKSSANSGQAGPTMIADLVGRMCSWHEPSQFMANGVMKMPLRPDILPGNRWRYSPFKNQGTYDFYIEGVTQSFVFGGPSTTSLTLSRGLSSDVYANPALLFAVFTGNAQRISGKLQAGVVSGLGPTLINLDTSHFQSFMASLARIYGAPGGTAPH